MSISALQGPDASARPFGVAAAAGAGGVAAKACGAATAGDDDGGFELKAGAYGCEKRRETLRRKTDDWTPDRAAMRRGGGTPSILVSSVIAARRGMRVCTKFGRKVHDRRRRTRLWATTDAASVEVKPIG